MIVVDEADVVVAIEIVATVTEADVVVATEIVATVTEAVTGTAIETVTATETETAIETEIVTVTVVETVTETKNPVAALATTRRNPIHGVETEDVAPLPPAAHRNPTTIKSLVAER